MALPRGGRVYGFSGFVPTQIYPVNYHSKDRMALVEVDCLFRPRDPGIDR